MWGRLFSQRPLPDNGNVSITVMAGQPVAVTETPKPCQFAPDSLETLGQLPFNDELAGQATTAHPHIDFEQGELISNVIQFGRQSEYQFYRQSLRGDRRRLIAAVPTDAPAYLHSFGLTPNYIVLVEFPLRVNPLRLATSRFHNTPFIENYRWQPELGTQFHLISRETGAVVNTAQAEPLFSFHHVNAYETGDEVVVDLSAYEDAAIVQQFYLDRLRQGSDPRPANANLRRYRVPLSGETATGTILADALAEVPRITYRRCNERPYRFVYGGDSSLDLSVLDRLVKVDVEARTTTLWQAPEAYPGEPVFVGAPNAVAEDEGVVLSVVLDGAAERSYLLVLDAQTFTEQARVVLPNIIPFHFHGQYFEDTDTPVENPYLHR
jgi:carotenoid cleavage dioxygenase-like enzyme